jgi:hypothetical protein
MTRQTPRVLFNALLTSLTQLGVNGNQALAEGGLVGKIQFLGASTAEVVSVNNVESGGWDNGVSRSTYSSLAWTSRGGQVLNGRNAGHLALGRENGSGYEYVSHRTILSGY